MYMKMTSRRPSRPANTTPGWYPLHQLDGAFQRFLLDELVAFSSASTIIDNELCVAADLVNLYTAVEIDWTLRPSS